MESNRITFSEAMNDPEKPDRDIVIKETFYRFDAWRDIGFNIRTICEGMIIAALESGGAEIEDVHEARRFLRFAQEKAKHYDNKLLMMIEEKIAAMESGDSE